MDRNIGTCQLIQDSSPFIMKMIASFPEDTLPVLEEGSLQYDNKISFMNRIKKHSRCSQFVEIVKIILYLELILFIGWIGCIFLSDHMGSKNNYPDSETVIALGSIPMNLTPSDVINRLNYESSVKRDRDRRSTETDDPTRESCERNINSTRERMSQLSALFIVGDSSDANVNALREICQRKMVDLTLRVIFLKVISPIGAVRPSDEEWNSLALNLTEAVKVEASPELRQQIEANGPPSQDLVNQLNGTIESMISNYKNCEKIIPLGSPSTDPSLADILNQRDICSTAMTAIREDMIWFIVHIVPGEQFDPKIQELREVIEGMTVALFNNITGGETTDWDVSIMRAQYVNITDQQWQDSVNSMRENVLKAADSEMRAKLENNPPPMQEMVNKIRNIVLNYVTHIGNCNALQMTLNSIRAAAENTEPWNLEDSEATSETPTAT